MTTSVQPARVREEHINQYQAYHRHALMGAREDPDLPVLSFYDWFLQSVGAPPATPYCLYTEDIQD